jgi:hypothetical protein
MNPRPGPKNKIKAGNAVRLKRNALRTFILNYIPDHTRPDNSFSFSDILALQGFITDYFTNTGAGNAVALWYGTDYGTPGLRTVYIEFESIRYGMYVHEKDLQVINKKKARRGKNEKIRNHHGHGQKVYC